MSTLITSQAYAADSQVSPKTFPPISFLTESAQNYFPQSLAVFASVARLTTDFASAIAAQNTAAAKIPAPVDTAPVMQVAIKPANLPAQTRSGPTAAAFETVAVPFKRLAALKKLSPSLDEMEKGTAITCRGKTCAPALATIQQASAAQGSLRDKLNAVNAAVNTAITYRSDMETNGVADHWATPSETLSRGQGDCEDFAILKMAALRAEGFDPAAMSIVALFDQKRRLYHAVLSVEVSGRHFILDNVRNQVLQDTQLPDYVALYSIRDGKGFLHGSQRQKQIASAITSMEKIAPGAGVN
ncbi:transglutaminase-like cysteine peptidase [Neorhizobium sp. BT27B]|uniref:transglutaminase-like cysteine peptidase n=1 Tax=Neorhizobium sp. BT27B TaxID=3142625 RepID=UPI003D2C4E23